MRITSISFITLFLLIIHSSATFAQSKVITVPMGDSSVPIRIFKEPVYLDEAVDKPIVWNKGWDQRVTNRPKIDKTVPITLSRVDLVRNRPGIYYTRNEIRHWGEQNYYNTSTRIYGKGVLLVDKGNTLEGGPFEWSLNNQGSMTFNNILRTGSSASWIRGWTDPRRGEKVWFFIMSDDERFSSNPISFIWPY